MNIQVQRQPNFRAVLSLTVFIIFFVGFSLSASANEQVFDDMEHGNPFANGWFTFGGSVGGGGLGPNSADLPPLNGGVFSLESGWGSGGVPGFFGGFGRTFLLDLSGTTYFNFWINPDAGQDYILEINLQDDDNGDNGISSPEDDEFQYNLTVGSSGAEVLSGGGWQLVSIPLADFFDDNSFLFGGNGVLDAVPVSEGGNGPLVNVVFAVIGNSGSDVTFRTDYWIFDNNILEIHEIQGAGLASPYAGQTVATEDNVVTAVRPIGFFMQTPNDRVDADSETSQGIFVYTGSFPSVAVGDLVDVSGKIMEFFGFTEFSNNPTVTVSGSGVLPAAVVFDATMPSPSAPQSPNEFERFEGMLIQIAGGTVVQSNQRFNPDPLAEVFIVAGPDRIFREPGIEYPGLPGLPVWDGNPEIFELDPDKLGLPNQVIAAGSSFDAVGVLGFEYGGYELFPSTLTVKPAVLPAAVRARAAGEVTVATLNLFRFFDDVDDPATTNSKGETRDDFVVSTADYTRRVNKFVRYILEVLDAPDILAVQEAEKLGVLQVLADAINLADGSVSYTPFLIEGNDIGTIDLGFLVRDNITVNSVTQLGAAELFSSDNSLLHERPPLALDLGLSGGLNMTVLNVHPRSMSGIADAIVQQRRDEQATSISAMVQSLQNSNPNLVVTGDFNAFEFTDGYVDVVGQISGNPSDATQALIPGSDLVNPDLTNQILSVPADQRYSFIFRGNSQAQSHMLTSEALNEKVTGIAFGRGNADAAADLLNDETTVLRASDHDGLVLYVTPPQGSYDIYVYNTSNGNVEQLTSIDDADEYNPSFSNNGKKVAHDVAGGPAPLGHSVYITDVATGVSTLLAGAEGGNDPSWSPNGKYIAFDRTPAGDFSVYTVSPSGGTPTLLRANAADADWSNNSKVLVFTDVTDNSLRTLDLKKGTEHTVAAFGKNAAYSQNGKKIAYSDGNNLFVVSVNTAGKATAAAQQLTFDGPGVFNEQPSWSNNGKSIVFQSNRVSGDVDIWELDKNGNLSKLSGFADRGDYDPDYTKDGKYVAYSGFTEAAAPAAAPAAAALLKSGSPASTEQLTVPTDYVLEQNYPNPFNPSTTIQFALAEAGNVRLSIYNLEGQLVRSLTANYYDAGHHQLVWDGQNDQREKVASGVYIYRIAAGNFMQTKKMIMMK